MARITKKELEDVVASLKAKLAGSEENHRLRKSEYDELDDILSKSLNREKVGNDIIEKLRDKSAVQGKLLDALRDGIRCLKRYTGHQGEANKHLEQFIIDSGLMTAEELGRDNDNRGRLHSEAPQDFGQPNLQVPPTR